MHISTKRTAHVQRNIFGNLIGSGFTKEEICFALEFTNADFKRYLTYQYEAEPATRNQKGYFAATLNRHTRPGKELPLPAIEFLGAIKHHGRITIYCAVSSVGTILRLLIPSKWQRPCKY